MKIIFLRHGESIANTWHHAYNQEQFNFLTLRGAKQAELAAYEINRLLPDIDTVYTSEFTRAAHTASTVMQTNHKHLREYTVDANLNEWWDDINGKTQAAFRSQISKFYDEVILPSWHTDESILVVSHYYTMAVMFEKIRIGMGIWTDHRNLDNTGQHIPNAVPFYFDTKKSQDIDMVIPGFSYQTR